LSKGARQGAPFTLTPKTKFAAGSQKGWNIGLLYALSIDMIELGYTNALLWS